MRHALALFFASLVACTIPDASGALRVHGVPGQGTLYLDGVDRGAIQAVQLLEPLAPRIYVLELRREGVPVFLQTVEVRPGLVLDVRVEAARTAAVAPAARTRNEPSPSPASTDAHSEPAAQAEPSARPDLEPAALPAIEPVAPPQPEPVTPPTASAVPAADGTPRGRAARDVAPPASPRADRVARGRASETELESLLQRALEDDAAALPARDAERARVRDAERAAALPELPETPSREDIARAMAEIAPAIRTCMRDGDTVTISLGVAGSTGRPTNVRVGGPIAGTPAGACVARAARGATFTRFRRPTFTVNLPFRR